MAEDLGKRLLVEVEAVGLDEIFSTLRLHDESASEHFRLPQLDRLIDTITETRPVAGKTNTTQPVIEITSTAPGGGKTHLLYHLTALAVLPAQLGGRETCVIIFDTDGSFSIARLGQQLHLLMERQRSVAEDAQAMILTALQHVHIFRPQSLASAVATLDSLPSYLFDRSRHYSFNRTVGFLALDSASALYWQGKAEEEEAALLSATTMSASAGNDQPRATPTGYAQLNTAVRSASAAFCCPVIFTSWHLGPAPTNAAHHDPTAHSLRPSLPAPLSQLPLLRLIVQRIPVRKFPAGISIAEAQRESVDRQRAVEEGRYECAVNEWGVDERTLQRLQRAGAGFGFKIKGEGLIMEDSEA